MLNFDLLTAVHYHEKDLGNALKKMVVLARGSHRRVASLSSLPRLLLLQR